MPLLLLKPQFLTLRNSLDAGTLSKRLLLTAIGAAFLCLLYIGTYKVLVIVRDIDFFGDVLAERLFSMIFFSLSGFLVLSNIIASISSFYLSKDMPFLLARPLGVADILRFKTLMTLMNSSWMVAVFLTPVLIAYGKCYSAPAMYYLLMPFAFSMFMVMAAGLGVSVAHLLTRVFPARRSRDIFVGAILVLFLVFYFVIKSDLPRNLSAPEAVIGSFIKFAPDSPFFPDYWMTKGVFPLLLGKKPDVFYVFVLFINAVFFLLLSSIAGRVFFLANVEKLLPSEKKSGGGLLGKCYPGRDPAFFFKDSLIFFRDKGQWSQIFVILALIAVYIYNFGSIPLDMFSGVTPFGKEIMAMINMVMAGLVLSAVAARFLYTSVSLEGTAFWVVRTSPVGLSRFLWLKLLYGCIPLAFLMTALVTLTNSALAVEGPLMLASVATILLLSISVSALATGLGAVYPKFRHENIAAVSVSAGAMFFMLLAFGLVIITVSLESWVYYLLAARQSVPHRFSVFPHIIACLTCIFVFNGAAFYLPMKTGIRRIMRESSS
jgi:ABC-2 type transport system permease protein